VHCSIEWSYLVLENRIFVPSGDHEAHESFTPSVSRATLVPSGSAVSIPYSPFRKLSNAIRVPSGEKAIRL
jgi:hypothetical protein